MMKGLIALFVGCIAASLGVGGWWVLAGDGSAAIERGHDQARSVLQSGLDILARQPGDEEAPEPASESAGEGTGVTHDDARDVQDAVEVPDQPETQSLAVVVPTREVVLAPARFSKVLEVEVAAGQRVEAGDVLARMDVRAAKGELAAARAAARAARAQTRRQRIEARRAEAAADRAQRLTEYLPAEELDGLAANADMAAADRRAASATAQQQHARTTEIQARIEDATVTAPFAGVIAQRHAEPGATLAAGEPVVHLISDTLMVRFAVPEQDVAQLEIGQQLEVDFVAHGLTAQAVVTTIAPEVDATARVVIAEAHLSLLAEHADLIRVGTIGRVRLTPRPRGFSVE